MGEILKALLLISSLFLIFIFLFFMSIESYCWFSPHIDTKFSNGFSIDKFNDIKVGDTKEKVDRILGEPLVLEGCGISYGDKMRDLNDRMQPCNPEDTETWQYSDDNACTWWDFAWEYYAIDFYDGVVAAKYNNWHGD